MTQLKPKKKRRQHTWGSIYNNALARGNDHGYAAYLADQWEARKDAKKKTTP